MSNTAGDPEWLAKIQGCLPRKMQGLTPEMVHQAEIELNETPTSRQEALRELKLLIEEEEDFRPLMDDQFLLRFLRARKFNTKAAMKVLKNYYAFKIQYSGLLTDKLPSELKHVTDGNLYLCSPYRDHKGRLLGLASLGRIDLDKIPLSDLFAFSILGVEICLQSEATQICGMVFVTDLKGLSLHLVRQLASPSLLYSFLKAIQSCLPIRLKAVHIINEPFYFSIIFNVIRTLMTGKMKRRFQCHGKNLENFHKEIPPEILPLEFGGYLGPMNSKDLNEEIFGSEDYFLKSFAYGYGEKAAERIQRRRSSAFLE